MMKKAFMNDTQLYLCFPQWQGAGKSNELYWGANALKRSLDGYHFVDIPVVEREYLEECNNIIGYTSLVKQLRFAKEKVELASPSTIFTIGGGCDVEIVPVSYLNQRYDGNMLVVWIDAHGDLNTPESSPSGLFHGMPLRALLREGDRAIVNIIKRPLTPKNVVLVGVRNLDLAEQEYIKGKNLLSIPTAGAISAVKRVLEQSKHKYVYIHIDLDVLDPKEFPYVKCPTPKGFSLQDLEEVIITIKQAKSVVGGSIVEYAPGIDNAGVLVAKKLFMTLVEE